MYFNNLEESESLLSMLPKLSFQMAGLRLEIVLFSAYFTNFDFMSHSTTPKNLPSSISFMD
jgi:hypothetical protein